MPANLLIFFVFPCHVVLKITIFVEYNLTCWGEGIKLCPKSMCDINVNK